MIEMLYMCLRYEANRGPNPISLPMFFRTYRDALVHAKEKAIIIENQNLPQFPPSKRVFYVKIFKMPYGAYVIVDGYNFNNQNHIDTVYDLKTTKCKIIQQWWRNIYNKRIVAAVIIKKHMRRAIVNPYTELCRRRLLREFNEMGNVN